MRTYILVIGNALHVISMTNNMIPTFIMREAGILMYDTHKTQAKNPTVEYHSIYFQETGIRIPIQLWGVF